MGSLKQDGFRFVYRPDPIELIYAWVHPLEIRDGDIDCTDMTDEEFEEFIKTHKIDLGLWIRC